MPAGCCGQFFSLSLPKKIISADVFLFHRCITISTETTITFLTVKTFNFPRKFALSSFRLPVCRARSLVSICFTFTQ